MKPFILTPRCEEILRTVRYYRYMTALDITYLLFSPGSLTHVRDILRGLCGGQDCVSDQYLYRFPLTQFSSGKTEKVYTLGSRGREFLSGEPGLPVDWYFRPSHIRHLSHGLIVHNLTLTRFLVAARVWVKDRPAIAIAKLRISYEMERSPRKVEVVRDGKRTIVKVIPDAWILFENTKTLLRTAVLHEIDRGSAYSERFKEHVRTRIEFVRSGAYERTFESRGCIIAYATTGELPEYRETRLDAMCSWTMDVLSGMQIKDWASILRFSAIVRKTVFETDLFMGRVWRRPDNDSPVRLLGAQTQRQAHQQAKRAWRQSCLCDWLKTGKQRQYKAFPGSLALRAQANELPAPVVPRAGVEPGAAVDVTRTGASQAK